ncbi:SUMF1/EgtB/PvdO family nonheme iron enzyme [Ferruginibacter sp. SUN106]|uniref:SUMF1/EgtB/PvdO family nonheme iron enzyme n=1 Tax=Ferruginibacter sp. SUN106 TaxID=2978348 RepID=UPI003D3678FE
MKSHKQKNIVYYFIFLFLVVSLQSSAQVDANLKSLKKTIHKTDKLLAEEFAAIKLIPAKTFFVQEYEGRDSISFYVAEKATTDSFYISPYEVTNRQYRQFVDYVQDSILRHLLGYEKQINPGTLCIDWSRKIDIGKASLEIANSDYPGTKSMFTKTYGIIHLLPKYLVYAYQDGQKWIKIPVMPDIDAWKNDYPYSYNEPMFVDRYFHPAFSNYPVTGVSFYQAQAYCNWKTRQIQKAIAHVADIEVVVSLPTLYQWEAAATSGRIPDNDTTLHSRDVIGINEYRRYLNKPIKANRKNGIDCNFFTIMDSNGYIIKNPGDDGEVYTMPVNAYQPGFNGLYNMKGNVAEWTATDGDECYNELKKMFAAGTDKWKHFTDSIKNTNPASIISTVQPDSFLKKMKGTKIVQGGSWKSAAFYIQPGVHQFYTAATQDGGIGFRYVVLFQQKIK